MTADVNSVNTKGTPAYHHGDLKAAAVAMCLEKLKLQSAPDLGLRGLARDLGVSPTALYRHFPSKDELLDELAIVGLRSLIDEQQRSTRSAGGGRPGFKQSGFAYVRWATENPALFRITFSRLGRIQNAELAGTVKEALAGLRRGIMEAGAAGVDENEANITATKAWALVHGLAYLIVEGAIEGRDDLIGSVLMSALAYELEAAPTE